MEALTVTETMQALAKALGKPCMLVSLPQNTTVRGLDAAPYLNGDEHAQLLIDGEGVLVFEHVDEMWRYFDMTVGDDGPTKTNPYAGPNRVYALTCGADGGLLTENT